MSSRKKTISHVLALLAGLGCIYIHVQSYYPEYWLLHDRKQSLTYLVWHGNFFVIEGNLWCPSLARWHWGVGASPLGPSWGIVDLSVPIWPLTTVLLAWGVPGFIPAFLRFRKPKSGHCTKCRYDLTGNVSHICPECGTQIDPKEFARLSGVNSVSTNPVNERNTNDK